ncbi:glycosyltransferase [Ornithinimicrobium murale]|uniref:glycosyltransferase n=1 Tax=Ornithinimicrobium murale TaxID=1050153 RepID=UPI000E0D3931|nr:glycosyltransferase [Ornithinimicrobium murale]
MNFHADEARDEASLRSVLAAAFAADPEAPSHYQELRDRDVQQSIHLAELKQQLVALQAQNADLTRRLGTAHGSLKAYRKESARLKADLKRVRGSRSYRMGKRIADPLGMRWGRGGGKNSIPTQPSLVGGGAVGSDTGSWVAETAATAPPGTRRPPLTSQSETTLRLSDYSFEELKDWLEREPSTDSLKAVLSRGWFQEGRVSDLARLLERHAEVVEEFTGTDAILPRRILGGDRVDQRGIELPPRAHGVAYLPERGRIMYCAHSTPVFNTNGYSIRTHGMATGLLASGEDVCVVARPGYPWDSSTDTAKPDRVRQSEQLDGVTYVHLPGSSVDATPFDHFVLEAADAFVREARLLRPSLIHAASNFRTALPALIAARRLGVPFVYEVRGLWEITEASTKTGWDQTERYAQHVELETLVATEADAVLAITEETRQELIRRGVPAERISLAPNAVDTDVYLPLPTDAAYAREQGIHTDRPVIGFTGSMVDYEGLSVLLDAVALMTRREDPEQAHRFQVVLAGSGPAEAALKARAQELGITDRVRFLGRLPQTQIPRLLSTIDIMPLPRLSLPVTEMVSPLKPLEALSAGKALVLSDVSPHRVFAGDDQDRARLVPAGDADALAGALLELIDDKDLRLNLGRAGRLWCLDHRTWAHVAPEVAGTHQQAQRNHDDAVSTKDSRTLASLRVGLIADEFTTTTLQASVQVTPLGRVSWREQLTDLDLVFIESAWEGNGGQWHRGVGQYEPEEHQDIVDLLTAARELGIPSVFWNKEDPVHFNRFVGTAALCDHIFTTDAGRIPAYLEHGEPTLRTVSALPFYAQPRIHNPLPTDRPFEPTVAYAGTYYGDRYAQRSRELASMLTAAQPHGLTIYDRQADNPDSPYHFPPRFTAHVQGSLPYAEVLKSYKSHLASLNVNSVADSPSMFSRRVVEVAASGGVVLSGPGRGVNETFGSAIPTSADPAVWSAHLHTWANDPQERLREAWLQLRSVLRSHTADTALTILARTAGLAITGPTLPSYAVVLDSPDAQAGVGHLVESLLAQSVRPAQVALEGSNGTVTGLLKAAGVEVVAGPTGLTADWVGVLDEVRPRTWFEDLLLATRYGDWEALEAGPDPRLHEADPISEPADQPEARWDLVSHKVTREQASVAQALTASGVAGLHLLTPVQVAQATTDSREEPTEVSDRHTGTRVVVAGHDLKFAGGLIEALQDSGARVDLDVWDNHTQHDEERSLDLLASADTVFCEWGLGNLEWYSRHVRPDQRLVVRVHLQELDRPYLARTEHANVDAYVFVGELIRGAAIRGHGVPRERSLVVPNGVPVEALALPKTADAHRTIGLVGILPERKRLDLALDVVEGLKERGEDYTLRIKGKLPADLPWMKDRPDELAWFDAQFARIDRLNADRPETVMLDGHGDDMAQWYRKIGVALSVSDFESFHLTIADGAASGALPAVLAWDGSDLIYPRDWLSSTTGQIVERIDTAPRDPEPIQAVVRARFEAAEVFRRLAAVALG